LGQNTASIQNIATDILFGQLRLVIATMDIEEINADRDKFLANVSANVEAELRKIGLKLINVNVTDIRDESGYIEALGKEAAAKAINEAKKSVAEQNRYGEIGKAEADRDKDIRIAETVRDTRIRTSQANALAVEGENNAKIAIANSDATRREKEAEAGRKAVAAEKVQAAKALEEAYQSERDAEVARADREKATQNANVVVPAQIDKEKAIIDAEADAERIRRLAKGEADAIFAKMDAEARGTLEILTKQATGYDQLVKAANNDPQLAALLLITDKLPELVGKQVEAIKNLKIDKITVWDSGANPNGGNSTSNFISNLMKSVPPLEELFNQAGLSLPSYLKGEDKSPEITDTPSVEVKEE
jgi:flotillin